MSIWTFLIILYKKDSIYDIISSLCEDKAALQPSAALPLVILFAIEDCSNPDRSKQMLTSSRLFRLRSWHNTSLYEDKAEIGKEGIYKGYV